MKGKCITRHSKVGVPHRSFAWFWGTPTEGLHGSRVPHSGFSWFWGAPQRVFMVLGYLTEGLPGSGVPHRGFTWFWVYPTEGLHKCLVFAVFWGERPKLRQQIPQ